MSDQRDLGTLVRATRNVIAERGLCCPACGADIELTAGLLICEANQEHRFEALAELATRERSG